MRTIGKYRIQAKIGEGAMGSVYKAFDPVMKRIVALKIPHAQLCIDAKFRSRFFHEARINAQLTHPNILAVHDVAESRTTPFLVMEYLDGRDLKREIVHPRLSSLEEKLRIMTEICRGLAYAHEKGVVHRDIKPGNIKITEGGLAKILDFGLARMASEMTLTTKGTVLGTLYYMAPERFSTSEKPDLDSDARSDIYSAGMVFYELLSNQRAFQAETDEQVLHEIFHSDPKPLREIAPNIPEDLARIIHHAVAKKADQRYRRMTDLLADLEGVHSRIEERKILMRQTATEAIGSLRTFVMGNEALLNQGKVETGNPLADAFLSAAGGKEGAFASALLPQDYFGFEAFGAELNKAEELIRSMVEQRKQAGLALETAVALEEKGGRGAALGLVSGILRDDPGHIRAREMDRRLREYIGRENPLTRASCLVAAGDLEGARSVLTQIGEPDPQNLEAAALLRELKRKSEEGCRTEGENRKKRGLHQIADGRHLEALKSLQSAEELLGPDPEIRQHIVRVQADMQNAELQSRLLTEIEEALKAYESGKFDLAALKTEAVLRSSPDNVEALDLKNRIDEAQALNAPQHRTGKWIAAAILVLVAGIAAWAVLRMFTADRPADRTPQRPDARTNATLRLRTNQPGVRVLIDGKEMGSTGPDGSATIAEVTPGKKDLILLKDGFGEWHGSRDLTSGTTIEIEVALTRFEIPPGLSALRVISEPPGANLTLKTPKNELTGLSAGGAFTFENLDPGRVSLRAQKTGYQAREIMLVLAAGKMTTYPFVLKPLPVLLQLTANPAVAGAVLRINGKPIAKTDSSGRIAVSVDTGSKQVLEVEADGYEKYVGVVDFNPGEAQTLTIPLLSRAAAPRDALLSVSSIPSGADVLVGEKFVGRTPVQGFSLRPGTYDLILRKERYRPFKRQVVLAAGNNNYDNLPLETESGRLRFQVDPEGVIASIQGQNYSADPQTEISLPPGTHEVALSKSGFIQKSVEVRIADQQIFLLRERLDRMAPAARKNEDHSESFLTLGNWENEAGWSADGALHARGTGIALLRQIAYDDFAEQFQVRLTNGISFSIILRASDPTNYYMIQLNGAGHPEARLRMTIVFYTCRDGNLIEHKVEHLPFEGKKLRDWTLIRVEARANQLIVQAGGRPLRGTTEEWVELGRFVDGENLHPAGRVGFRVLRNETFDVTQMIVTPMN
jgi:tRNA A-37 threonylcarbamoyl transferase component Bud32